MKAIGIRKLQMERIFDGDISTTDVPKNSHPDDENDPCLNPQEKENLRVSPLTIIFTIISMILYLFDTGYDVYMACNYYRSGYMTYFWLTIAFVVIPGILITVLSILLGQSADNSLVWQDILMYVLTFLQLGPVFRDINVLYYGVKNRIAAPKSEDQEYYYVLAVEEEGTSCLLRFCERFLEQAPQVTLQMFIWLHHACDKNPDLDRISLELESWLPGKLYKMLKYFEKDYLQQICLDMFNTAKRLMEEKGGNFLGDPLQNVECPTLVLHGVKDHMLTVPELQMFNDSVFNNSRIYYFPDGAHNLHLRFQEEFVQVIQEFLNS